MSSTPSNHAQELKLQGNKFYSDRHFSEAFKRYKEASALEPTNIVFLANQSAVLFETGLYGKCVELCDEILAKTTGEMDVSGLMDRLKLRKARSLVLLGKYDAAVFYLRQHPQDSLDEWKSLVHTAESFALRDRKCFGVEIPPLAFECSIPSVRGSLLPLFYHFDHPISEDCPTSILTSVPTAYSSTSAATQAQSEPFASATLDLLFAHNRDPRHLLETLKHAHSLASFNYARESSPPIPHLSCYMVEQNPKLLARMILILFVLGHPDLDATRAQHASDFVYFIWTGVALIPPHWTMLTETLHELCKLSFNLDTWRLDRRSSWIQFGDDRDLKMVRDCWIVWGTVTEEKELARTNLLRRMDLLKHLSNKPMQAARSNLKDRTWTKSPECSREMAFYLQHRIVLPRPPLLEGDTSLPPASMSSWMLNPLMDVLDQSISTEEVEERWIPEPRPDSIFPFGIAQQSEDLTPFSVYGSTQLYSTILALKELKKHSKLTVKAMCGNMVDLLDVGSRLGAIAAEGDGLSFDRIHTGCMADAIGLLETFVNASLLLKKEKGSAFVSSLNSELSTIRSSSSSSASSSSSVSNAASFDSIDHLLFNKLRLERRHIAARFGLETEWKCLPLPVNSLTLLFRRSSSPVPPSPSSSSSSSSLSPATSITDDQQDTMRILSRIDVIASSNESYTTEHLVNNWFVQCSEPPSATPVLREGPSIEPAAPNLATFCRLLCLLLENDTPAHWVTQAIEKFFSLDGQSKASILSESTLPLHSNKPRSFSILPYITELSTLLEIAPGRRLWKAGIQIQLPDISTCHWYQAENVKVHNFAPTRRIPHNPSIAILIVDKRVNQSSKITLVERLSTVEGRSAYHAALEEFPKEITVVSSVYWNGPPKVTEPSQVTLGFWLPSHFTARAIPSSAFSLLIFRLDLYLCIGLSSLSSMVCTTGELSE